MIEWLISFGNGCHYITMAFLLLYLLWLVRESFARGKAALFVKKLCAPMMPENVFLHCGSLPSI